MTQELLIRVEMQAGERHKFQALNENEFVLEKVLPIPSPFYYGSLLGYQGADGDLLDGLFFSDKKHQLGDVVKITPVDIVLREGDDHKIIGVVDGTPLPSRYRRRVSSFFKRLGGSPSWGTAKKMGSVLASSRIEPHAGPTFTHASPFLKKHAGERSKEIHLITSDFLLDHFSQQESVEQLRGYLGLDCVVSPAIGFADLEKGSLFPEGAALMTRAPYFAPFALGRNVCGFRLLATSLHKDELTKEARAIMAACLERWLDPDSGPRLEMLRTVEPESVLTEGLAYLNRTGLGNPLDQPYIENLGRVIGASTRGLPEELIGWAKTTLGTMGWWGHCLEILYVAGENEQTRLLGLSSGQVVLLIHIGSRFWWPFVIKHYLPLLLDQAIEHGYNTIDQLRQNVLTIPTDTDFGQQFLQTFRASENFAYANRAVFHRLIDAALAESFGRPIQTQIISDNHHVGLTETVFNGERVNLHRNAQHLLVSPHAENAEVFTKTGFPLVILGAPEVPSLLISAGPGAEQTYRMCMHGIAINRALAPHLPAPQAPAEWVYHNTSFRTANYALATQNLLHFSDIFRAADAVREIATLIPLVNFRANPERKDYEPPL